jgi:hypothetical protein
MDSKETDCDDADWINLAENRLQWLILMNTAIILTV